MNTNRKITIGTHNGIFHQDDVVAAALLSILHGNNVTVKRTRDPVILATCDYVVDVGGGEFDHHMLFGGVREDNTPYASAGLVWKKYADDILKIFGCPNELICDVSKRVDKNIIQDVDKIDNGWTATSLFDFIPLYIPNWNEDFNEVDNQFNKVLSLTVKILSTAIKKEIANASSDEVMSMLIDNNNSHILEIPNQYIDWKPAVIDYNCLSDKSIDFVIFPYPAGGYAAQAVPPTMRESFEKRIPFPIDWAGLTYLLPKVSGVKTATFCHKNLFFVRAKTKEDVIKLCEIAMDQY